MKYKSIFLVSILFCIFTINIKSQGEMSIVNGLSEKLANTEGGIWVFEGFKNGFYYTYVLYFFDTNEVSFSYNTCSQKYGLPYICNIFRRGTYYIENNILIISFNTVRRNQYNVPNNDNELTIENTIIRLEMEIIEYKLIVKQISGITIFENHNKNETIELIAERPIID